jgi:hypothetical protein
MIRADGLALATRRALVNESLASRGEAATAGPLSGDYGDGAEIGTIWVC